MKRPHIAVRASGLLLMLTQALIPAPAAAQDDQPAWVRARGPGVPMSQFANFTLVHLVSGPEHLVPTLERVIGSKPEGGRRFG